MQPALTRRDERGLLKAAPGMGALAPDRGRVVVAEGDSWFDLPWVYVQTDVLDCLHEYHGYKIESFARRGDTLENMAYGTERVNNARRRRPSIDEVIEAVRAIKPRVFLFSGGGNDFVGDELGSFLNHADSGMDIVREDYAAYMFETVFRGAIERVADRVAEASPGCLVAMHGYANPIPDGRGARVIIDWAGPWMLPTLTSKNVDKGGHRGLIIGLVEKFNRMLGAIAASRSDFLYVDVREQVQDADWVDELHLRSSAYQRVAAELHRKIAARVPGW